jgi:hypothetical protein
MTDTVKQILDRLYPDGYMDRLGKVYTDTSDFMRITGGDVIILAGEHYLVLRDEMERSFGVEDPKYWVKRCRCRWDRSQKWRPWCGRPGNNPPFFKPHNRITLFQAPALS